MLLDMYININIDLYIHTPLHVRREVYIVIYVHTRLEGYEVSFFCMRSGMSLATQEIHSSNLSHSWVGVCCSDMKSLGGLKTKATPKNVLGKKSEEYHFNNSKLVKSGWCWC